jgi:uncharacterized protein
MDAEEASEEGLLTRKLHKSKMPRPCKRRRIRGRPHSAFFKPSGIPASELESIVLARDEFEAIRLKDFLGADQKACADQMGISQPTFHRLLISARKKLADAVVNGKAIMITEPKI